MIEEMLKGCKDTLKKIRDCSRKVMEYEVEDDPRVKWKIAQLKSKANDEMDCIRKKYQKEIDALTKKE
jgi:hypothetical protein